MLISPNSYAEIHLNGKDIEGVQREIRRLKRKINKIKRELENPKGGNFILSPSPMVQLRWHYEYLKEAILYLTQIGGEYTPSRAEKRAKAFSDTIGHIKKITLCIEKSFEIPELIEIALENDEVIRTRHTPFESVSEKLEGYDRQGFLEDFDHLMIGMWRRSYSPKRYGICAFDGEGWTLKIEYENGIKTQVFKGSNAYPYNFSEMRALFCACE